MLPETKPKGRGPWVSYLVQLGKRVGIVSRRPNETRTVQLLYRQPLPAIRPKRVYSKAVLTGEAAGQVCPAARQAARLNCRAIKRNTSVTGTITAAKIVK